MRMLWCRQDCRLTISQLNNRWLPSVQPNPQSALQVHKSTPLAKQKIIRLVPLADLLAVFVSGFVVVHRHTSLKFTFGHLVSILRHELRHRKENTQNTGLYTMNTSNLTVIYYVQELIAPLCCYTMCLLVKHLRATFGFRKRPGTKIIQPAASCVQKAHETLRLDDE